MIVKCVCSDCGKALTIEVEDGTFTPANCISCGGIIQEISSNKIGDHNVAWIK